MDVSVCPVSALAAKNVTRVRDAHLQEVAIEVHDVDVTYSKFVAAVRGYNWELALNLAASDEERQDVHDSRERVALMYRAIDVQQYEKALRLAITNAERRLITNAEEQGDSCTRSKRT